MHRRIAKFTAVSLLVLLVLVAIAISAAMWRLSQGPVSLSFLKERIEKALNHDMGKMRLTIGDVIIEQDKKSGHPKFRLRRLSLYSETNQLLAQAPRAAIQLRGKSLLQGDIVPKELELIGARLLVVHKIDGSMQLGFGIGRDAEDGSTRAQVVSESKTGRADRSDDVGDFFPDNQITNVLDVVNHEILSTEGGGAFALLDTVRISKATISLYDERNNSLWYAPRANLVFQRMNYGYMIFADADVATKGKPWRTEIVANYRTKPKRAAISARIFNLVPANIAKNVFAFTDFAKIDLPLDGHAEFEITRAGKLVSGTVELQVGKGKLEFPGYIANPVAIDEGLLRFDYEPKSGDMIIGDSTIFTGGSQAQIKGRIQALLADNGRLNALRIKLQAGQVSIDADTTVSPLHLDKIIFQGVAALNKSELTIEKLEIQSGKAKIKLTARLYGSKGAIGVDAIGIAKKIPAQLLKRLWPPAVAHSARRWISQNIDAGEIKQAKYNLTIAPQDLANILKKKAPLPDDSVAVEFSVSNVTTKYFGDLPPVTGAGGIGKLSGGKFSLQLQDGTVKLPSGKTVIMTRGTMDSKGLGKPVVPTTFKLHAKAPAQNIMELIDMKPLGLMHEADIDPKRITGNATIDLTLNVPLHHGVTREDVTVKAKARLQKAGFKNAADGIDLTAGDIKVDITEKQVKAYGPAKLNGTPVKMTWVRKLQGEGIDKVSVKTTIGNAGRQRLGVNLDEYISGPITMQLDTEMRVGHMKKAHIVADLTKTAIRLDQLSWSRAAGRKTTAVFDLDISDKKLTKIRNIDVKSSDFRLSGDVLIDNNSGFKSANLSRVILNKRNRFAVNISRSPGRLDVNATGASFDARPFLKDAFKIDGNSDNQIHHDSGELAIKLNFKSVVAYRGEVIRNVKGSLFSSQGGIRQANIAGNFSNGAPIQMTMASADSKTRKLRVIGRDAGAVLQAANLYSKISRGKLKFVADLGPPGEPGIRKGKLTIRKFSVLNDDRLMEIERKTARKKGGAGPRTNNNLHFSKLTVPFSVNRTYVLIGDALVRGVELGASATGRIRKVDGAMDISGTIIPAYALNSAVSNIPLIGTLLTGGRGQGIFGLNFALRGTMSEPNFLVNPVSALAPGFLRKIFEMGGNGVAADGTAAKPRKVPKIRGSDR